MDKEQAEAAAEALMGEMRRKQSLATAHMASDAKSLNWLAILLLAILGALVGAVLGFIGHRVALGAIVGLVVGVASGLRRR